LVGLKPKSWSVQKSWLVQSQKVGWFNLKKLVSPKSWLVQSQKVGQSKKVDWSQTQKLVSPKKLIGSEKVGSCVFKI
jgi:hypothetical protein